MASVAIAASIASGFAPTFFHRLFGLREGDSGASRLAWRLFGARTAALGVLALRDNQTAISLFGPLQIADQVSWWFGYRRREVSLPTALVATGVSGIIIGLDLDRRRRRDPTTR